MYRWVFQVPQHRWLAIQKPLPKPVEEVANRSALELRLHLVVSP